MLKSPLKGRRWRQAGAGVALFLLLLLVATVQTVDYSPFLEEEYFTTTIARAQAAASNSVAVGELQAGLGRALLTPAFGTNAGPAQPGKFRAVPLAGYGDRKGRPAEGVHDDVYAKAVAFKVREKVVIIIGADALIIPREVADRAVQQLREELRLTREQLYFGATHTHASLGGWGQGVVAESFAGPYDPELSKWFSQQLVAAARAAVADLKPAVLGSGAFTAPEFVRNRLVGELGRVDPEFRFALVKQSNTGRVGVIGSYAAHATVLSAGNMEFSGDYPGYWQRAVEEATGGIALFLAGGVGSHSPIPGARGFEGAERMGNRLAELVKEQLPMVPLTNIISFGIRGLQVDLPSLHARLTDHIRLRPWLARQLLPVSNQTFLQAFRLNDAVWISTPCDFSGELAIDVKHFVRAQGMDCVVTSFNGDYIGYVVPARYYHLGGYEPQFMSFYGPAAAEYMEELMRRLAVGLRK